MFSSSTVIAPSQPFGFRPFFYIYVSQPESELQALTAELLIRGIRPRVEVFVSRGPHAERRNESAISNAKAIALRRATHFLAFISGKGWEYDDLQLILGQSENLCADGRKPRYVVFHNSHSIAPLRTLNQARENGADVRMHWHEPGIRCASRDAGADYATTLVRLLDNIKSFVCNDLKTVSMCKYRKGKAGRLVREGPGVATPMHEASNTGLYAPASPMMQGSSHGSLPEKHWEGPVAILAVMCAGLFEHAFKSPVWALDGENPSSGFCGPLSSILEGHAKPLKKDEVWWGGWEWLNSVPPESLGTYDKYEEDIFAARMFEILLSFHVSMQYYSARVLSRLYTRILAKRLVKEHESDEAMEMDVGSLQVLNYDLLTHIIDFLVD